MMHKTFVKQISYSLFLDELSTLLADSGITTFRMPVRAEADPAKSWQHPSDEPLDQKVGKVILYMEEHLSEELSLDELADKNNISKYQLIRGFRKEEGTTPWKFLVQRRIENVKKLLEDGMSPGQAALESGFYDQPHMSKAFRDATGQTPKEYQEENFKNKN